MLKVLRQVQMTCEICSRPVFEAGHKSENPANRHVAAYSGVEHVATHHYCATCWYYRPEAFVGKVRT